MSSRRKVVWGLILGMICMTAILSLALRALRPQSSIPSTYSAHPSGSKALYLVLQELGLPVERWQKALYRLNAEHAVLVMIDPGRVPFSPREIRKLKEWIRKGNRLVLFEGPGPKIPEANRQKDRDHTRRSGSGRTRNITPARAFGLTLKRFPDNSRRALTVSIPGVEGLGPISVSNKARWKKTPKEWTSLAGDRLGPVLLVRKLGKGTVAALSDPTVPSNGNVARAHNLRLVLALLLGKGRPAQILFDEYHHGYIHAESLSSYVASSVFSWILLQALVGMVLFFYSSRARLSGRYQQLSAPRGRSPMEHVESMANIFESSKASSVALEAILAHSIGQLSRRTGLDPKDLASDSVRHAPGTWVGGHEDLAGLVAECRRAVSSPDDPEKALGLARRLAEARAAIDQTRLGRLGPGLRQNMPGRAIEG
ncbi:MAG: DUF4350 domain-containing protein [Deltaproteobacteria bacterium]